jgi:hypothetical protein
MGFLSSNNSQRVRLQPRHTYRINNKWLVVQASTPQRHPVRKRTLNKTIKTSHLPVIVKRDTLTSSDRLAASSLSTTTHSIAVAAILKDREITH